MQSTGEQKRAETNTVVVQYFLTRVTQITLRSSAHNGKDENQTE